MANGSVAKGEALGFQSEKALISCNKFRKRASMAFHTASTTVHLITPPKFRHIGTNGLHDARQVGTKHSWDVRADRKAFSDLYVDLIDGSCMDLDKNLPTVGGRTVDVCKLELFRSAKLP
ncbi:hypothetical protein AJ87_09665 [Rhizobium yanglingense]|nr:hypothetical protein AJ87_09665 [Rhizobium yanglingense]